MKLSFWPNVRASVDGIGLVSGNDREAADFVAATSEALALIHRFDPRRHGIVVRAIRHIVNGRPLGTPASYFRHSQICIIDFEWFQVKKADEHYEWYLAYYAVALVHEATHGRLDSLCFPYIKATRERIERICRSEERRFARRIASKAYDFSTLVSPYDETDWQYLWSAGIIRKLRDWLRSK